MSKKGVKASLTILLRIVSGALMLMHTTFLPFAGTQGNAYAAQQDSFTMHIVLDVGPALPVTDLVASHDAAEGSIRLNWTAPLLVAPPATESDPLASYIIKYATFSVASLSNDTTAWWNNPNTVTGLIGAPPVPKTPGEQEVYLFGLLDPGVDYYFGIKSKDTFNNVSDFDTLMYSVQASTHATDLVPIAPTGFTAQLQGAGLTAPALLTWDDMTGQTGYMDFDYYQIYRSTTASPLSQYLPIATSSDTTHIDTTLGNGSTYYYYVTAKDRFPIVLESAPSGVDSVFRPALTEVTIAATDPLASESGNTGLFTITRSSDSGDLTVYYTISGTAQNGVDYNTISASAIIYDTYISTTIPLIAIDDALAEGRENVILTLTANAYYQIGSSSTATVVIVDNEPANYFELTHASTATVYSATAITVRACDVNGNTVEVYTGTATFASSGLATVSPSSHLFTAAEQGVYTLYVSDDRVETVTATATDIGNSAITGTSPTLSFYGTYISNVQSLMSAELIQGVENIPVLTFTIAASTGTTVLSSLLTDIIGSGSISDIAKVKLYQDNGNSAFSTAEDVLVSSSSASLLSGLNQPVAASQVYYIAYDIAPSATVGHTLGLQVNSTAYFTVASGLPMATNNIPIVTSTGTVVYTKQPASITDLSAAAQNNEGKIQLEWTAPKKYAQLPYTGMVTGYEVRYATIAATTLGNDTTAWWNMARKTILNNTHNPGEKVTEILDVLPVGTTYYFAVRAYNLKGNTTAYSALDRQIQTSAQAGAYSLDIRPIAPANLSALLAATHDTITLTWDDMSGQSGYLDLHYYKIYRSVDESGYVAISTASSTSLIDYSIRTGATFNYYITAVDSDPLILESVPSTSVSIYVKSQIPLPTQTEKVKTLPPYGFGLTITNGHPVLTWNTPIYNEDKTTCSDSADFRVYRSTYLYNNWLWISTVTCGGSATHQWTDTSISASDTHIYYYKIQSVDTSGNVSKDSTIRDTSPDLNMIFMSSDTHILVAIPDEFGALLKEVNPVSSYTDILSDEVDTTLIDGALFGYEIYPADALTYEKITGVKFNKSIMKVIWQYQNSFNAIKYAPANLASLPVQNYDNQLSIFWYNGVEWIKIGKENEEGAFSFKTQRFGKYVIKQVQKASSFVLNKVYPTIFSPNGDNRNDLVEFQFENPKNASVSGKIFDLRGARVADLKKGPNTNYSLIWDGRMTSGTIAQPGTYIYQIEVSGEESKITNGIVILAR